MSTTILWQWVLLLILFLVYQCGNYYILKLIDLSLFYYNAFVLFTQMNLFLPEI